MLGAEIVSDIMLNNSIKLHRNYPSLHETVFGWIVYGALNASFDSFSHNVMTSMCNDQLSNLNDQIVKFWEIENCGTSIKQLSSEEQFCEKHFMETIKRSSDGRFVLRLPFKPNVYQLGESKCNALRRFRLLERKLNQNHQIKLDYTAFMNEYQRMNHMTKITEDNYHQYSDGYFIPHHPVFKESTTTRLRVVFDASSKSSSGTSLNDYLIVGPTVQDSLWNIIIRFCMHNIVITGDIKMHFRQIWIDNRDRKYLKILWRTSTSDPICEYVLNIVTYGTACAPYQATKCIQCLAQEMQTSHPHASKVALSDLYMDDLLTGAATVQEAISLRNELTDMLQHAGFHLRKWTSNSEEVLLLIPVEDRELQTLLDIDSSNTIKTLGIAWSPATDMFTFKVNINQMNYTKRSILSEISKLFNPFGLISPIIILAKLIMQDIWKADISWDTEIPSEIKSKWISFYTNLINIKNIKIPRKIFSGDHSISIDLVGFCDASERAYGACIYICSTDNNGIISSSLLCSKSRVAPTKIITIPRLELCAALLLSELISKVKSAMNLQINRIIAFTDSTITLHWIKSEPYRWKVFIAHRITKIQSILSPENWHHVSTTQNPADLISRGVDAHLLIDNRLWWNGPEFLQDFNQMHQQLNGSFSPEAELIDCELKRKQMIVNIVAVLVNDVLRQILQNSSTFTKLCNVTVYCLRAGLLLYQNNKPSV